MPKQKFPGVFLIGDRIATLSNIKGYRPFGEQITEQEGKEYRHWDPNRSKAGAAIVRGIKEFPLRKGSKILYLGAAHGYTCSFFSNIVGEEGIIYAVEFSDRCFREFLPICDKLTNIVPICADARKPELYEWIEPVDIVYVDIAQPDLTEIAIRNAKQFLKHDGYMMIAIKTQSIDVTKSSKLVTKMEVEKVEKAGFEVVDWLMLDPFEEKHGFILAKMK